MKIIFSFENLYNAISKFNKEDEFKIIKDPVPEWINSLYIKNEGIFLEGESILTKFYKFDLYLIKETSDNFNRIIDINLTYAYDTPILFLIINNKKLEKLKIFDYYNKLYNKFIKLFKIINKLIVGIEYNPSVKIYLNDSYLEASRIFALKIVQELSPNLFDQLIDDNMLDIFKDLLNFYGIFSTDNNIKQYADIIKNYSIKELLDDHTVSGAFKGRFKEIKEYYDTIRRKQDGIIR